eukprot:UN02785
MPEPTPHPIYQRISKHLSKQQQNLTTTFQQRNLLNTLLIQLCSEYTTAKQQLELSLAATKTPHAAISPTLNEVGNVPPADTQQQAIHNLVQLQQKIQYILSQHDEIITNALLYTQAQVEAYFHTLHNDLHGIVLGEMVHLETYNTSNNNNNNNNNVNNNNSNNNNPNTPQKKNKKQQRKSFNTTPEQDIDIDPSRINIEPEENDKIENNQDDNNNNNQQLFDFPAIPI